ncbi:MAG: Ig-like domain-containing protein [Muribaculaceae bacterium]|nr:Ig-like domain-containing protein [Muribaculaceae bacterium]
MKQNFLTTILLLLSIVAPFAASADSFKVKAVNLEPGNPEGVLEFVLVNTQEYYGFQAEVTLPAGLTAVPEGDKGDLDITLSDRAKNYQVNSNTLADGTIIMGAFSQYGKPFTGNDGVLASMKVKVAEGYKGGDVEVTDIYFIDAQDKDVEFDPTSTKVGIGVTEINLDPTEVELKVGETKTMTWTVAPANASDKTLKWKSGDTAVATVDASGKITAKGIGETTITATCACGHVSSTCTVKVIPTPVTGLEVQDENLQPLESGSVLNLETGDSYDLTAVVKPANASDKKVTWTSSDEAVATVDAAGLIDTHKAGEATITASIAGFTFTVKVVVTDVEEEIPATGISLDQTKAEMKTGGSLTLKATVIPEDTTDKRVTWSSSDKETATVTGGVVKALKAGTVTITATVNKIKATCEITITDIEVTKVELDQTAVTLQEEETVTLKAKVSPKDATDQTVTWESSDEDVATVTDEGVVTAISAGTATITATSGKVSATCEVTVEAPFVAVETITLDKTTAKVEEGKTVPLRADVRPVAATNRTVTWTSSDEAVATVDSKGIVTGVKAGTAVITAKAGEKTATCTVTVTAKVIAVTGITLSQTEATIEEGKTATLTATVAPENATDKTVTWSSSNEAVATVKDGVVTAVKPGTAVITAVAGDETAECTVTVTAKAIEVESITLSQTEATVNVGEPLTLVATVTPSNATDATVTWSSSNEAIATVDQDGKVTLLAEGVVVITAQAGDKKAECTLTVSKTSGVAVIGFDADAPVKVYNLCGQYVADTVEGLQPGLYIVRQGNEAKKVRIR